MKIGCKYLNKGVERSMAPRKITLTALYKSLKNMVYTFSNLSDLLTIIPEKGLQNGQKSQILWPFETVVQDKMKPCIIIL